MFEVTPDCNNNCLYCYNVWKASDDYPQGELELKQIKYLFLPLINSLKLEAVTLTGGEPTLRPDLIDIIRFFKDNNVRVSLATNGTLVDDNLSKAFREAKLDSIEIPLLSIQKTIHNELTQSNSFDFVVQAIKNTIKNRIPTAVVFVATKKNIHEAVRVLNFADSLGVDIFVLDRFIPGGNGLKHIDELGLKSNEINECIEAIKKELKEGKRIRFSIGIPLENKNIRCASCLGGQTKFAIDFLGNLRICEQHPIILGNLFKNDFFELVKKEEVNAFRSLNPASSCKLESLLAVRT